MKQLLTILLLLLGLMTLSSTDICAREDYGALLEEDCEVCHIDRYYPGGEFIEAEETYKWQILWVMTAITLLIFAIGVLNTVSLWRLGKA